MPGDVLCDLNSTEVNKKIIFGPGLRREADQITAIKCGVLKRNLSKVWYIDNHQMRYVPSRGENVIGIIIKKGGDEAIVDIGCSEPAIVDLLSFEGATKRNKPQLKTGDILFAKILTACKDMEAELVCVDGYGKSVGFGVLPADGFMFTVSLEYARRLLSPDSYILKRLGQKLKFEIAVGVNGRVWLKSTTTQKTLVLSQAITVLEHASATEVDMMCVGMASENLL